jgi:hypothetical protein
MNLIQDKVFKNIKTIFLLFNGPKWFLNDLKMK